MFTVYSLLLTLAFALMSPLFLMRREKYAAGFRERLGFLPVFDAGGRPVIWLHCVSVGETNAARSLVDQIHRQFPSHSLVVSTTTRTGQELAREIFKEQADAVFYFPFDWKFTVRRALGNFRPSVVLLMETEIWPNFIREAKMTGAKVAIVNGRLSQKSFVRYSKIKGFLGRIFANVDLALMQAPRDAERMTALGMAESKTISAGNLKFDQEPLESEELTDRLRARFGIGTARPLVVAASTHEPEERILLEALRILSEETDARMMIVPRHPRRFDEVAGLIAEMGFSSARRSASARGEDRDVQVILLDSMGELRSVYPLAELVFCGGSLIPHGGQSMLEPATEGKAVVTGFHTENFANAVEVFAFHGGLAQLPPLDIREAPEVVARMFAELLADEERRKSMGRNARDVMVRNRGAAERTAGYLRDLLK